MGWRETLTEKARDRIVTGLFALITLLLLAVWKAIDPSVWGRVSEVVPKRALWALVALELIVIGLLVGTLIDNRKRKVVTVVEPEMHKQFGVLWDNELRPHCPVDKTLLHLSGCVIAEGSRPAYDILQCPKCKAEIPLYDEDGHQTLLSAKDLILSFRQLFMSND